METKQLNGPGNYRELRETGPRLANEYRISVNSSYHVRSSVQSKHAQTVLTTSIIHINMFFHHHLQVKCDITLPIEKEKCFKNCRGRQFPKFNLVYSNNINEFFLYIPFL